MIMEELLELKSITKIIQNESDMNNTILDHVDLTINKGDFITVLGGNGARKSTLFNSITGSQSVTSGQIDFKEKNVTTWSEENAHALWDAFSKILRWGLPHV